MTLIDLQAEFLLSDHILLSTLYFHITNIKMFEIHRLKICVGEKFLHFLPTNITTKLSEYFAFQQIFRECKLVELH